jgi:hypothetical protein
MEKGEGGYEDVCPESYPPRRSAAHHPRGAAASESDLRVLAQAARAPVRYRRMEGESGGACAQARIRCGDSAIGTPSEGFSRRWGGAASPFLLLDAPSSPERVACDGCRGQKGFNCPHDRCSSLSVCV